MARKLFVVIVMFLASLHALPQSFAGKWKGLIQRQIGGQTRTDSIRFELKQDSDSISGYSMIFFDSINYIKAAITGEIIPATKTVRLTEISIIESTVSKENDIIPDIYIFQYYSISDLQLSGKSVSNGGKQYYTRSMVVIEKQH